MSKAGKEQEIRRNEMTPFQEVKVVFSHLGPAFSLVSWRPVIVNSLAAYFTASLIMLLFNYVDDHSWELGKALAKALLIAGVVGFSFVLRQVIPIIQRRMGIELPAGWLGGSKEVDKDVA